ncbi:hypothetical protein [Rhizobium sp. FKY42]|uniref:hypothetical protein n=1 Tax=Rhizobium sp. FKY42 TaxID=2562310 RepID=UPI0014852647|nr:hypothetical protein [Rhizobium sp. FKY42]
MKFDAPASGKTGSPSGIRQSETPPRRLPLANAHTDKPADRSASSEQSRAIGGTGAFCADTGPASMLLYTSWRKQKAKTCHEFRCGSTAEALRVLLAGVASMPCASAGRRPEFQQRLPIS